MNYIALSLSRRNVLIVYEKKSLNSNGDLVVIGEIIWNVGFIPACNSVISIKNYRRKNGNITTYLLLKIWTKIIMK